MARCALQDATSRISLSRVHIRHAAFLSTISLFFSEELFALACTSSLFLFFFEVNRVSTMYLFLFELRKCTQVLRRRTGQINVHSSIFRALRNGSGGLASAAKFQRIKCRRARVRAAADYLIAPSYPEWHYCATIKRANRATLILRLITF